MSAHDEAVGLADPDILRRIGLRQNAIRPSMATADGHRRDDGHREPAKHRDAMISFDPRGHVHDHGSPGAPTGDHSRSPVGCDSGILPTVAAQAGTRRDGRRQGGPHAWSFIARRIARDRSHRTGHRAGNRRGSLATNAANQLVGSADCGDDGTFTFVVTENNGRGGGWNPAFITRTDGATALFIRTSFDLTFTSPDGTFVDQRAKGATSGPASCDISASPAPGSSLTGTVTGTIIWTS